jgi:hypothetical protein
LMCRSSGLDHVLLICHPIQLYQTQCGPISPGLVAA